MAFARLPFTWPPFPSYEAGMRVPERLAAGLSVPVALAVALALALPGCTTDVLHELDEASANEAMLALERAGIPAGKEPSESFQGGRFTLRVPNRHTARALAILTSQGLPREPRQGLAEIYARPGLIPSPTEERARFVLATVGEIERTLESVDGVLGARVHLVPIEAEPRSLDGRGGTVARAAVLLRARRGHLGLARAEIQQLVAGSVPGLEAAAVSVIVAPVSDAPEAEPVAWTSVGPFVVARGSRPLMLAVSVMVLAVIGALSVLLLFAMRRRPTTATTAPSTITSTSS